ncbi:MAG: hypothetical protein GXP28_04340, partial [Planctomycetes bacterium]|nr:hypothetical protein [Planctomycetota bacterium]
MQSAMLFLLTSSMGVLFGWQPMPDGSPRYEYVVQLDPDLLATLEAGGSIPISSDIPEDIQPIGRIRIVIGSEPLPRTRLTTALKPVKKSREGLVETQHRVAPVESTASGRYSNGSPQTILPPSDANSSAISNPSAILPPRETQGLAGSLQGTTQSLGNQLRNVGESVRTDAQQMFGQAGNNAVSGVVGQIGKTVDQLQGGFQQGAEPFRQAAQQTGQHLRNAAESIGQQTREAVNQFGRPLREQSILSTREDHSQTILPPSSAPPQQQFAGNQSNSRGQQPSQPVSSRHDPREASPWNNSAPPTSGNMASGNIAPGSIPPPTFNSAPSAQMTTNPKGFSAPWPSLPQNDHRNQASQPHQQSPQPQILPNKIPNDRFDLANHPTANQPATAGDARGRYQPNDKWAGGPNFPADDRHSHASSAPEIRRNMLDKPADTALRTSSEQPSLPALGPQFSQSSERRFPATPVQAGNFGRDNTSRRAIGNAPSRSEDPTRATFPL